MASITQTANGHLTFNGVPIDVSLNGYVSKIKSAGFSYISHKMIRLSCKVIP